MAYKVTRSVRFVRRGMVPVSRLFDRSLLMASSVSTLHCIMYVRKEDCVQGDEVGQRGEVRNGTVEVVSR